jgi:hypothetical protein
LAVVADQCELSCVSSEQPQQVAVQQWAASRACETRKARSGV